MTQSGCSSSSHQSLQGCHHDGNFSHVTVNSPGLRSPPVFVSTVPVRVSSLVLPQRYRCLSVWSVRCPHRKEPFVVPQAAKAALIMHFTVVCYLRLVHNPPQATRICKSGWLKRDLPGCTPLQPRDKASLQKRDSSFNFASRCSRLHFVSASFFT